VTKPIRSLAPIGPAQDSSPMMSAARRGAVMNLQSLGCVTRGSRNIALAIHTDDVVIWFTVGEDPRVTSAARRGNLALVRGDSSPQPITVGDRL